MGQFDEFNFRIWVDDVLLLVRQNLLCALRALRMDIAQALWIDALCINQTDGVEKAHQVATMGSIYRRASEVVAYLGEDKENSKVRGEIYTLYWAYRSIKSKKGIDFDRVPVFRKTRIWPPSFSALGGTESGLCKKLCSPSMRLFFVESKL
jgi:Heterokaryon incompatibility protein (HET)